MRRFKTNDLRYLWGVVLAMVLAVGLSAAPLSAQSGVVLGTGEEILHLLDNNGGIAVDFDVDDVNSALQEIRIGRADTAGTNEMNIDIQMIDNDSTLGPFDVAILLDASLADLSLGSGSATEPGDAGDLIIENGLGVVVIDIAGDDGDINQDIDNVGTTTDFTMNGAVKAWAMINLDGTVARCWKCNTSNGGTQRLSLGEYEVDFLLGDIDKRPHLVSLGCNFADQSGATQCFQANATVSVSPRFNDLSSLYIHINDSATPQALDDRSFTVVVF